MPLTSITRRASHDRSPIAVGDRRQPARRAPREPRRRTSPGARRGRQRATQPDAEPDADAQPDAHAGPDRADRPRRDRDVLRPRLRPRRRHVAVRRQGTGARRPGRPDDPRPLLPGHDPRLDPVRDARSASGSCTACEHRPTSPLVIFGRRGAVDGRWRGRDIPGRRGPACHPQDDRDGRRVVDHVADQRDRGRRSASCTPARSRRRSSFAARTATTRLQLWSKPTS